MRMKGRPTDAIKDTTVKVRLDDHTRKMLAYCVEAMNLSKSSMTFRKYAVSRPKGHTRITNPIFVLRQRSPAPLKS